MINHVISGGKDEVMGLMYGKVVGKAFYVLDSFALPIKGFEAGVVPVAETMEWAQQFNADKDEVGRLEGCCGWYHSHPGLSVFMSATDCTTQENNQAMNEPWLAIVIDPKETMQ